MSRLVVLTTSFPQHEGDAAGHFVASACRRLADVHDVHVVCAGGAFWRGPIRRDGLTIHGAGGDTLFRWPGAKARLSRAPWRMGGAAAFALGVRKRLADIGPDGIVAHWMLPCAFPLLVGYRAVPLQLVAHGADVRLLNAMPRHLRDRIVGWLVERSDDIQFVASSLREQLLDALSPGLAHAVFHHSFVEPCAIEVPARREDVRVRVRRELGVDDREPMVTVCGRLVADKRVDLAFDAATRLDAHLVIVGDGPDEAALRARAQSQRATFTGRVTRDRALDVMAASDAVWSCSATEAAPTVIREARALGVSVVATAAGDVRLWAAGDSGLALADAKPEAFAEATRQLLRRRW